MKANLVQGEWVEGPDTIQNINPSDLSDVVGEFAAADTGTVNDAVNAARQSLTAIRKAGIQARADALDRIGSEILNRREALGELLAREEGKTLPEAIGEAARAGYIFKYFAGEVLRLTGDLLDSVRPGLEVSVVREPLGVVGLITPWNFPIAIPAWKIAPALAYGNAVVFKPSEIAPACAWELADIIARSGVQPGSFNLVMGGAEVGAAITAHADVDAVSFTGSAATGAKIAATTIARGARLQMEMGGKNPLIVMDDAELSTAVNCAIQGAFFSTGQRCTASSRIIVTEGIHDAFVEQLINGARELVVGHALHEETQIGPVVDMRQFNKNQDYIGIAENEGAEVIGGQQLSRDTDGYFMAPGIFLNTENNMRINQEEIFGPLAAVIKVSDFDEAVAVANDTAFGLSAGIVTSSLKLASAFRQQSRAGMVMVNVPTAGVDYHVPFGGIKGSSLGTREQGSYAKEFYTNVKTTYIYPG